jgi:hypothetical protein
MVCVKDSILKHLDAQLDAAFLTMFVGLTVSPTLVVAKTLSAMVLMLSRKGNARPVHLCP